MNGDGVGLPPGVQALATTIACELAPIEGVVGVALGGSHAKGTARPDSDVDLGLYYHEAAPFSIEAARRLASLINDVPTPTVTGFGGFHSYIYLGEVAICHPLHDPLGVLAFLKARVAVYPPVLRRELIREWLEGTEVWWPVLRKSAARGDDYNVAGSVSRVAAALTQVLFALYETYFVTDKGALERIDAFALRPEGYSAAMRDLLACPGSTLDELLAGVQRLEALHRRVIRLCGEHA